MLDLFLLALEGEEIVAIGYRESAIARRLATMPIPEDVREILHHGLVWAGKTKRCTPSTSVARSCISVGRSCA
jgi:hypothetical protein